MVALQNGKRSEVCLEKLRPSCNNEESCGIMQKRANRPMLWLADAKVCLAFSGSHETIELPPNCPWHFPEAMFMCESIIATAVKLKHDVRVVFVIPLTMFWSVVENNPMVQRHLVLSIIRKEHKGAQICHDATWRKQNSSNLTKKGVHHRILCSEQDDVSRCGKYRINTAIWSLILTANVKK